MTFLPLRSSLAGGNLQLDILGKDGAVLASSALDPEATQDPIEMSLGALAPNGRQVRLSLFGRSATLLIGRPPDSELLPRPLQGNLKVGDTAPEFALKTIKGDETVRLSDARGRQPTILVFGSFT